jgi:hypothetical protein
MELSKKGENWMHFATTVLEHIENYAVPQYGSCIEESVDLRSAEDCIGYIMKWARRAGVGRRGRIEELRDLVKIAHCAQLAFDFNHPNQNEKAAIEGGTR